MKTSHEALNGVFWTPGRYPLKLPPYDHPRFDFFPKLPHFVANNLRLLDKVPVKERDIERLLKGFSLNGLSVEDEHKVGHYLDCTLTVTEMVGSGDFELSLGMAETLHASLAKDETVFPGELREENLPIPSVDKFTPPPAKELRAIADRGFNYLNTIEDPVERACLTFLFIVRNQLFPVANKRLASLLLAGELMNSGFKPFTFTEMGEDLTLEDRLISFYNSGDADVMLEYFSQLAEAMDAPTD